MSDAVVAIVVNGEARDVVRGSTVAELVATTNGAPRGIAVAVNREIVPRGGWAGRVLHDGDRVDIVQAIGGG